MSAYSRFYSWDRSCLDRGAYGSTAGDSFWQGLRDYNQLRPCPNGLELDTRQPSECEHWRRRIEKAKRDIEWHRECSELNLLNHEMAEVFSAEDVAGLIALTLGALND